jgi:hypothetical protein
MTRRTLLQTLLGSGVQLAAAGSPMIRWRPVQRPRLYRTVGRNPRGAPVLSWQDALGYMQSHPKFWKDLTVLLPQGLEPQVRAAYWPGIVQEVHAAVEMAQAHHFMNGVCPLCSARKADHCEHALELSHRFQRLAIPRGTQYLSLTEGEEGRVSFNRIFIGDAIAYRVNVLEGRGFIDLIARCRNTALGQRQEWEAYTAFTPPARGEWETHTVWGPPPVLAAEGHGQVPAAPPVGGGGVIVNNYPAPPRTAYTGPGQAQSYPRGYQAGGVTLWFRQDVRVRINQAAPTAVAAASGAATQLPVSAPQRPALVVGPSTFQTPSPAPAPGSGIQVQGPIPSAPAGPSLLQFPAPLPTPTQAPVGQFQGPAQH